MVGKILTAALLLLVHQSPAYSKAQVLQWRVIEFAFVSENTHEHPAGLALTAIFAGPDGVLLEQPGFWDGGNLWKVRFAPPAVGEWSYLTVCPRKADEGLCGRTGRFTALTPTGDNALHTHGGFLRVSENRRYLTYSDGTPFFWLGDTWWFCPSKLCPFDGSSNPNYPSMFKHLIDTRRKQGFTVVQMAFLDGNNSLSPTSSPDEWSEAELEYWRKADHYITYANEAGIVPVIGIGFHENLDNVGSAHLEQLWRYVIARYGGFAVTWLIVGEYNLGNDPWRIQKVLSLGRFIKQLDPYKRAMTVHPSPHWHEGRQAWDQPWNDFIMIQCGHNALPSANFYLGIYQRKLAKPILEAECHYEGQADRVRLAAYRAIQSGSFGYTYGAHGLWYPTQSAADDTFKEYGRPLPWWQAAARPGATQMQLLREIYGSVDWWDLEPQPNLIETKEPATEEARILTKAKGTETYVIYFPKSSDPTTQATLLKFDPDANYAATWMSPTKSERIVPKQPLELNDTGLLIPTRPDTGDWVLILRKITSDTLLESGSQ